MSRYDRELVKPLWQELSAVGVEPLSTAEDVDRVLSATTGTTLLVVNSVCGCAAGSCRPGVALSLQHATIPDRLHTVFAGVDLEATQRAREYLKGIPPSSPSVALFKDGQLVYMLQRSDIEGNYPQSIAQALQNAYDQTCSRRGPSVAPEVFQRTYGSPEPACGSTFRIKS
jgi:putative YphP/YqiW family bacilliredoxin